MISTPQIHILKYYYDLRFIRQHPRDTAMFVDFHNKKDRPMNHHENAKKENGKRGVMWRGDAILTTLNHSRAQ